MSHNRLPELVDAKPSKRIKISPHTALPRLARQQPSNGVQLTSNPSLNSIATKMSIASLNAKPPLVSGESRSSVNDGGRRSSITIPKQTAQPRANATIFGIMASRRLAKNLINRYRQGKQASANRLVATTYQLEPKKKFSSQEVESVIKTIVDSRMRTFKYNPKTAALLSKILSTEIKEEVKKLQYDRYKIVCFVALGEKKDQSGSLSSRCVWDTNFDNIASYSWDSSTVFCSAKVYGVYHV